MRELTFGRGYAVSAIVFVFSFMAFSLGAASIASANPVKITSPKGGSVVEGTVSISLKMASGTSWANVYVDGNYLASTPDSIAWSTTDLANGDYTISAEAFDSSGTMIGTADRAVHVRNRSTPTPTATATPSGGVSITSPQSGATVSGTVSIVAQNTQPVSWVNFYVDGTWVASSPPFTLSWNSQGVSNGSHTISVNGYNDSNALIATATINLNVNNGAAATPTPTPTAKPTPTASSKPTPTPSSTATPYYSLLPAGSTLPSDSACASGVAGDTYEPRPDNAQFNNTMPTSSDMNTFKSEASGGEGGAPGSYLVRADGQFTGSTDAILKWAACKWGFDENVTRATAVNESYWNQDNIGDVGNGISLGILQIKSRDYPSTCEAVASSQSTSEVTNSNCYSYLSTAFAADYKLAQQRACFEGQVSYLTSSTPTSGYPTYPNGTADQMMWGCVGWWYSGQWYDSGALNYISQVKSYLSAQTWAQSGF